MIYSTREAITTEAKRYDEERPEAGIRVESLAHPRFGQKHTAARMRERLDSFEHVRYVPENLTLVLLESGYDYDIDLERCDSCGKVLDWIMQSSGKSWTTPAGLGELARALDILLRPQGTMCSFGRSKPPLPKSKLLAVIRSNVAHTASEIAAQDRMFAERVAS